MKTFLSALAVALSAGPIHAQDAMLGQAYFMEHCAACHGPDATGTGPLASVLTISPANLTQLSVDNNGVFPAMRVAQRIDGRDPLVSHGSEMPVYGDFFQGSDVAIALPTGQPMLTSRPIADLIAFLEGVQVD